MNKLNNKTEMDAEELTLAPETELLEEAKRIAEKSAQKETASFFKNRLTNAPFSCKIFLSIRLF